jgi:S1-C subfamily serine protease
VNGIALAAVVRGSPAAAAGLLSGDLILKADGESVIDGPQLMEFLQAHLGHAVTLHTLRGQVPPDISVTLASY